VPAACATIGRVATIHYEHRVNTLISINQASGAQSYNPKEQQTTPFSATITALRKSRARCFEGYDAHPAVSKPPAKYSLPYYLLLLLTLGVRLLAVSASSLGMLLGFG
jgi:hypothetical protein